MSLDKALGVAHSHLLKSKIAYLEGDSQKAVQHAIIAGDIATYTIFNKAGGIERIISFLNSSENLPGIRKEIRKETTDFNRWLHRVFHQPSTR